METWANAMETRWSTVAETLAMDLVLMQKKICLELEKLVIKVKGFFPGLDRFSGLSRVWTRKVQVSVGICTKGVIHEVFL